MRVAIADQGPKHRPVLEMEAEPRSAFAAGRHFGSLVGGRHGQASGPREVDRGSRRQPSDHLQRIVPIVTQQEHLIDASKKEEGFLDWFIDDHLRFPIGHSTIRSSFLSPEMTTSNETLM
jgi:hypothetical protein